MELEKNLAMHEIQRCTFLNIKIYTLDKYEHIYSHPHTFLLTIFETSEFFCNNTYRVSNVNY